MQRQPSSVIHLAAGALAAPLSAPQAQFNTLVQRIAEQREALGVWDAAVAAYRVRHAHDYLPLLDAYHGQHAELVQLLDGMADRKLSKADRAQLHELIASTAAILAEGARDESLRAAMQALHDRYAPAEDAAAPQAEAAPVAGEDEEVVDPDSPEAVARQVEEQMEAARQRAEQARAAHQAKRRKKPGSREQKQQHEAKQASQSLREVYRRLASSLHPDRESDPVERERKTALMQRANRAYDAGNLLELLELQWEAEHLDPAKLASFSDERLAHYNRVLAEQLAGLQREVAGAGLAFAREFGLPPARGYQPAKLMALLRTQMQQLQADSQALQLFLRELRHDPDELKRWLKQERRQGMLPEDLPD
ncbi:MAG: molecular chaperone DnaJ [Comamonas sp.]